MRGILTEASHTQGPVSVRATVRQPATQVAIREQTWDEGVAANRCAANHIRAVEEDIASLRRLFSDLSFEIPRQTKSLMRENRAVVFDILPSDKQRRVEIAIGENYLAAEPFLNQKRTLITEASGFWRFLGAAPTLLEVLRGD